MPAIRIQEAASWRLDEIYRYTRDRWGDAQAERYITGLFEAFERIESRGVASRPVPAEFGVEAEAFMAAPAKIPAMAAPARSEFDFMDCAVCYVVVLRLSPASLPAIRE